MPPPSMPELVSDFAQHCVKVTRAFLNEHGQFSPMAFLGTAEKIGVLPLGPFGSTYEAMREVRLAAKAASAIWTLVAMEAWTLRGKVPDEDRLREEVRAAGSVHATPGAVDCVMFVVETPLGVWMGHADQVTVDGHKTFGDVVFEFSDKATGNFIGLLPAGEAAS